MCLTDIPDITSTMIGVAATLAIGGEILRIIQKESKLQSIEDGIAYYRRHGNLKKVIEGYLRYMLVKYFE